MRPRKQVMPLVGVVAVPLTLLIIAAASTSLGWALICPLFEAPWDSQHIQESQRRGDPIVAALLKYKAQHGKYPASLEELLPAYLSRIERPTAGMRRWIYRSTDAGASYRLAFGSCRSGGTAESPYPSSSYWGGRWEEDN